MSEITIDKLVKNEADAAASVRKKFTWRVYVLPVVIATLTVGVCMLSPEINSEAQAGVQMELPNFLGGYIGLDQEISRAELEILPADTEFARKVYHNPQGDRILFSIVLAGGEKRSIHRPEACLPGQGWTIKGGTVRAISLADGREIKVMDLSLSREVEVGPGTTKVINSHYFYFFVGHGVRTPNHFRRVFMTSWDRVFKGVNHRWAYVIISSNVTEGLRRNGKNNEQTIQMLEEFTAQVAPYILKEDVLDSL
jgi:EpsI family protein